MENTRQSRVLEIFFRGLRGEDLSVQHLADEYGVSTKSITRSINDLKAFLADHRELVGETELRYSHQDKCYRLHLAEFLNSKELFALMEVVIGSRAFSKEELLELTGKLKHFTTPTDRRTLTELIRKELYHYPEVRHDCDSVQDRLWQLVGCIENKQEISITYYRMDRKLNTYRLRPASVLFMDYYFYLIAFKIDGDPEKPRYFRIDRIKELTIHRKHLTPDESPSFDEGLLRRRSLFMWPGKLRTLRFEFTGPSVQAVLDKLPTAKIIEHENGKHLIEAEVYGDGIKMWLLSQGAWMKVLEPEELAHNIQNEIRLMKSAYETKGE